MDRKIFMTASLFGGIGVVLGAFAAHGFKPLLSDSAFDSFNTGIRYQIYHAFLLFFVGITTHIKPKQKSTLLKLILTGILLFSGSIYFLSTNSLTAFDFKIIGIITPIGGMLLIASWALLFICFLRIKK